MKFYVKNNRPIKDVPRKIVFILVLCLCFQCVWHLSFSNLEVKRRALPHAPELSYARLFSLDDVITMSKWMMLWLQAFDNQPGVSIPLKELSYDKVIEWLDLILALDERAKYPLLSAIRFYAEVADEERQRKMVNYVSKKFIENPNERWPFMAHAVHIAKHRIKDNFLALKCAQDLRHYATGDNVPHWAKQMEIFILEDMGELLSAKIIIGGLLESGELDDPYQKKFLEQRLEEIEKRQLNESFIEN